jgi:heat shock protein HslJ
MTLRFSSFAALSAVAALVLVGCATPQAGSAGADAVSIIGTWGDENAAYLTFLDDGSLQGSDGCNGIGGTYTESGDTITVTQGFSTLMACPGVDTWLRDIATASIDGTTLVVLDSKGSEIGTLTRAG